MAEISTDNPNVWFELGFAIASQKEVVLVCSKERTSPFPFDVQHRSIISYSIESTRDFQELKSQITSPFRGLLQRREQLQQIAHIPSVAKFEGLEQYEIAALVSVAQQIEDPVGGVSPRLVRDDMEKAGFTNLAAMLGLRALLSKKMLEISSEDTDFNGNVFTAYPLPTITTPQHSIALRAYPAGRMNAAMVPPATVPDGCQPSGQETDLADAPAVSDTGISWLIANQKTLALKHGSPFDDEIPF